MIVSTLAASADHASIFPAGARLEVLYTHPASPDEGLTEGPAVARDGSIYFSDMTNGSGVNRILRYDPRTRKTVVFAGQAGKCNGNAFLADGALISCDGADGGGRRLIRWNLQTGRGTTLVDRIQGRRLNSPNDLCVDLQGRIYFTDPRYGGPEPRELEHEAVYRLDPDGTVVEITWDVERPNGLALSPDQQTLYIGDHNNGGGNRLHTTDPVTTPGAMKVYAFPLDGRGRVCGPRRTLVDFGSENGADGMRVDTQGNLYLAVRSLARPGIMVINPDGKELAFLETEPRHQQGPFADLKGIPSNLEFGTGDDADSLYLTIDRGLYRVRVNTRGFHPHLVRQ